VQAYDRDVALGQQVEHLPLGCLTMEFSAFDDHERRIWRDQAQAYADSYAGLCGHTADALLDAAGVGTGVATLDVGTGIGTVAATAAGRGAIVTAVDAEPSMVAWTRDRVPSATVEQAILPDLPFGDAAFAATVANFVINHVGDPAAAVTELKRVTAAGGRVAVTIWPNPAPPLQSLWNDCFEAAGAVRPTLPTVDEDRNFGRTTEGLKDLLRGAGLRDVSAWSMDWVHRADPELWWSGPAAGLANAGAVLAAQTPEVRERIRAEYDKRVGGWLELPTSAIVAVGTK
jgi:SAM-dependent methyltransferase